MLVIEPRHVAAVAAGRIPGDSSVFGVAAELAPGGTSWGCEPGGALAVDPQGRFAAVCAVFSGVAFVKADADYGAIRPGDLLTTSATPGHAMRADAPAPGTVLGKALEPLDSGMSLIRVLITLR